jgi:hypothetical protein
MHLELLVFTALFAFVAAVSLRILEHVVGSWLCRHGRHNDQALGSVTQCRRCGRVR